MRWLTQAPGFSLGILLLALGVEPAGSLASATARWELLSGPADTPPFSGRAVHDSRRHRMVYIEGVNPGEIWTLSLPARGTPPWQRIFVVGSPPPVRNVPSVVYDSLADRVLMFGGKEYHAYNDVWALSLAKDPPAWSQLQPLGDPPAARIPAGAIFDPVGNRMVLWGGDTDPSYDDNVEFTDTWSLELAGTPTWRRIVSARSPRAPIAKVAYDPWGRRMLLHETWSTQMITWPYVNVFHEDVWALSLAGPMEWDSLSSAPAPMYDAAHVAIVDPVHRELIVATDSTSSPTGLWAVSLNGAPNWRRYPVSGEPPASLSGYALSSPERGSTIQFDPYASYELNLTTDTWSRFTVPTPAVFPPRRARAHMFVDSAKHDLFVFGAQCLIDLYRFRLDDAGGWERLPIVGDGPPNCTWRSGGWTWALPVFDPIGHRILDFFGSNLIHGSLDQVWALPLDPPRTWTRLQTTGPSPRGRFDYSLMFDPARNRVLLFGGAWLYNPVDDFPNDLGDLWAFSLDSLRWTPIPFTGGPGPRREPAVMFDPGGDRLLLVGGLTSIFRGEFTLFDSWSLPLGSAVPAWTPLGPDLPLGSKYDGWSPTVVLDPIRNRLLAWDGSLGLDALPLGSPSEWRPIGMGGDPPTQRIMPGATFDTQRDQMLMFGGFVYETMEAADLRALRSSHTVVVDVWRGKNQPPRHAGDDDDALRLGGTMTLNVAPRGRAHTPRHPGATVDLAILSAPDFSPDSVIVSTVTLGGAHVLADAHPRDHLKHEDLNGDGVDDLMLRFPADSLKLSPGSDVAVLLGDTPNFGIFARVPLQSTRRHTRNWTAAAQDESSPARALALSAQSPSIAGLTIHYSLASIGAPAQLEVFDIAGRRVADRELAWSGDGNGTVSLGSIGLRPGVFLVRLTQDGQAVVARVVMLQ